MTDVEVNCGDDVKSLFTTDKTHPLSALRDSGILWMINRQVFWPYGIALGLITNMEGEVTGWQLLGDGSSPITTDADEDALLDKFHDTIMEHLNAEHDVQRRKEEGSP